MLCANCLRDLDYILTGKSITLILIYVFPWSGSLAKNINNLNPSSWHMVIKCNFPLFQERLIANSFLPNLSCVLLYS